MIGFALALTVLLLRPVIAGAEIAPDAQDTWGVSGLLASGSNNFEAQVWDFAQRDDMIYAGGKFTEAVAGPGGRRVPRMALAAFDADRGTLIESFDPDVRGGAVYALALSPDGSRLFVAGEFTSIEGIANTAGLAALDPVTGALDPIWRAGLERPWSDAVPVGRALDVQGPWLYVAGNFTHIDGGGVRRQLSRVGRVDLATGQPDAAFAPAVSGGGVWDIDPSPDGSRLYLAGFFTSVNADASLGNRFAAVDTSDGSLVPGVQPFVANLASTGRQYAVVATDTKVFVGGEEHMLQVLDASTLTRQQVYFGGSPPDVDRWALSGGGDFQVLERVGDRVYAGCHCWRFLLSSSNGGSLFPTTAPAPGTWTAIRSVAAFDADSGTRIDSFRLDVSGAAGAWAVLGAGDGCLWVGGDLTQSSGRWLSGMGRWCDESTSTDTERPSPPKGLNAAVGVDGASATLTWQASSDDVAVTQYAVYRSTDTSSGTEIGRATDTSLRDTGVPVGVSVTYSVKAIDAAGNLSWRSNQVSISVAGGPVAPPDAERPSTPKGLTGLATADGVELTWNSSVDNVAVTGYDLYRSTDGSLGSPVATSSTSSFRDTGLTPGVSYTYAVKAHDAAGNQSWRSNLITVLSR